MNESGVIAAGIPPCDPVACERAGCTPTVCTGAGVPSNAVMFERSRQAIPGGVNSSIRAFKDDVLAHIGQPMVDVRSPGEFSGELLHMPDYPQEGAMRGGHVPGARSVPWARAAAEDATFKSRDDLAAIYQDEKGLRPDDEVIAYCRIGERSSHTWFVLTHLLGFANVRNYDGSWTEWGNAVRTPIRQGGEP
mgnify:CR=1 FL=1